MIARGQLWLLTVLLLGVLSPQEGAATWTTVANYPSPIMGNAVAEVGGKLYSFAGWENSTYTAAAYSYDPGTNTWAPIASLSEGL